MELERAHFALARLGTNAVPTLLEAVLARPSGSADDTFPFRLERSFPALMAKLPVGWLANWKASATKAWDRAYIAKMALREVKPPADVLLAGLRPLLADPNQAKRVWALELLGNSGSRKELVLPIVTNACMSSDWDERGRALGILDEFVYSPPELLPFLLQPAVWTNSPWRVAHIVARMGPLGRPALPWLRDSFRAATDQGSRCQFAAVAIEISADEGWALEHLRQSLRPGTDKELRASALRGCSRYPQAIRSCLPQLLDLLTHCDEDEWQSVANALLLGDAEIPAQVTEILLRRGGDAPLATSGRANYGRFALHFSPQNTAAMGFITDYLLASHTDRRDRVFYLDYLDVLRRKGTNAVPALSAVSTLLTDPDPAIGSLAQETIWSLQGDPRAAGILPDDWGR
jgi:hypothetical protein